MDGFTITIIGCLLLIILGMGATVVVAFRKVETILNETEKQIAGAEHTFKESTDFLASELGRTITVLNQNARNTNAWVKKMQDDVKRAENNTNECMRLHALRKNYEE